MKNNKHIPQLKQQGLYCSNDASRSAKTLAASLALEFPLLGVIHLLKTASPQALLSRGNEEPLPVEFPTSHPLGAVGDLEVLG